MRLMFEWSGWVLAVGALAAASVSRHRTVSLAEAVARICHELRGPLTAARLAVASAFRAGALADSRLKAIELELSRATLALEDLAQVRASGGGWGDAVEGCEEVDVAQLLGDAVEAWHGSAAAFEAELQLLESRDRPLVRGRRLRLAQAVGNLIANAIEHGGGLVIVSCRAEAANAVIEVRDHGPGLPATVHELAHRRCGRFGTSRMRRGRCRPGSRRGHGLAIVSAIATAHGGRLTAVPADSGARLVLELPMARTAELP